MVAMGVEDRSEGAGLEAWVLSQLDAAYSLTSWFTRCDHTAEHMGEALENLPAVYREPLVLKELEGLSYKEIALITKVPMGTVMSRFARARKQLRKRLDQKSKES